MYSDWGLCHCKRNTIPKDIAASAARTCLSSQRTGGLEVVLACGSENCSDMSCCAPWTDLRDGGVLMR